MLDGDNVHHGLCGDLGFSATDRTENIRRIGEVKEFTGVFSPYKAPLKPELTVDAATQPLHAGVAQVLGYLNGRGLLSVQRESHGRHVGRGRRPDRPVGGAAGLAGGTLMTPLLLLVFGLAPLAAVGTDLWFGAITKLFASRVHHGHGLIDGQVVTRLWLCSLVPSALTLVWMKLYREDETTLTLLKTAIAAAVLNTKDTHINWGL